MTVDDLHDLTTKLKAAGQGNFRVILASDPEGNGFAPMDSQYGAYRWDASEPTTINTRRPNTICFYPE